MKIRIATCRLGAVALLCLAACSGDRAPAAARELDAGALTANVEAAAQALIDTGRAAGIVTMIAQRGEILLVDVRGYQDASARTPMRADSIFAIASMTKPVTATAMMMLYEEGGWSLDDPVSDYLPEMSGRQLLTRDGPRPARTPMTMRHLMTHTAGLPYGGAGAPVRQLYAQADLEARDQTMDDMTAKLAALPLAHEPGADWTYGMASDLQAAIVERLTGQKFDAFVRARILQPLGMADTDFFVPPAKQDRLALIHGRDADGGLTPVGAPAPSAPPSYPSGGAGLYATAGDYMTFAQMLLNGGEMNGRRLLRPETVALMHTNALPHSVNRGGHISRESHIGFGLGFAVLERPEADGDPRGAGTYYWEGAYGTFFWIDPANDLIAIGLSQRQPGGTEDGSSTSKFMRDAIYASLRDASVH